MLRVVALGDQDDVVESELAEAGAADPERSRVSPRDRTDRPEPSGLDRPSRRTTTLVTTARRPPRSRNRAMPSRSSRQLLRAPEPTQPSNSRAARSIQREPAQEPMRTGGPPRAVGQTGSSEARPTRSPAQSRRMIASDSSRRRKRETKSRPSASKSAAVDPAPTPRRADRRTRDARSARAGRVRPGFATEPAGRPCPARRGGSRSRRRTGRSAGRRGGTRG